MSQQHAHSDQNHFNDSASYSAGYEESPRYQGYSANIDGQKLSPSENQTSPTAQQRLILAIVSPRYILSFRGCSRYFVVTS